MTILVAFDKFKDSMSAMRACEAAEAGIRRALTGEINVQHAPLTDGGEGFCRILTEAGNGHIEYHPVSGPLGEEIDGALGWVDSTQLNTAAKQLLGNPGGRIAVIEMATAAGLEQVPFGQRHPRRCTTRGVGDLLRIAAAEKADSILLGTGGSATSDLGLGALEALGLQFGQIKGIFPQDWAEINRISGRLDVELPPIHIACDVDNPLLGARGAAAVYGPQKGLQAHEIEAFDSEASKLARLLCAHFNQAEDLIHAPGCGAAGGIGFGLKAAADARFVPGFELVAAWLDLPAKVARADFIITGEGKFDESSLSGKGPFALIVAADRATKPACLFAGAVSEPARAELLKRFPKVAVRSITASGSFLEQALAHGPENLEQSVYESFQQLADK